MPHKKRDISPVVKKQKQVKEQPAPRPDSFPPAGQSGLMLEMTVAPCEVKPAMVLRAGLQTPREDGFSSREVQIAVISQQVVPKIGQLGTHSRLPSPGRARLLALQ